MTRSMACRPICGPAISPAPTRWRARCKAGTVNINNTDGGDITAPFGGYKQSGIGRDKSLHALEKYQQIKHTYIQL